MVNGIDVISVLVVEDDLDTGAMILSVLSGCGVEWRLATNRDGGVKILDAVEPDFILVDLIMPGLSLDDFLIEARRKAPQAHIILMSAYQELMDVALRHGLDYMVKPFEKDALYNKFCI